MSDSIPAYIERVEKTLQQRQDEVTEADLQEIARDLGMTDADLAAIEAEVQASYERGSGFVDHEMWKEAASEFQDAVAMAPTRVYILHALANALYGLGVATKDIEKLQNAEEYSKRCLNIDPQYQPAFVLLGEIKKASTQVNSQNLSPGVVAFIVLGIVVLLMAGGGAGYFLMASGEPQEEVSQMAVPIATYKPAELPIAEQPIDQTTKTPTGKTGVTNPPVKFDPAAWKGKITLDVRESKNSVYKDSAYFAWKGLLKNTGDSLLTEVKGKLEFIDSAGDPIVADLVTFASDYQPAMRPGDSTSFYATKKSGADIAKVKLTLTHVKEEPAAQYAPSPKIPLGWDVKHPSHIKLEIRERTSKFRNNSLMKSGFFSAVWEVKNAGEGAIKTIKVRLKLLDKNNTLLDDSSWLVVFSSSPSIGPGETRVAHTTKKVGPTYDHYELSVVEIN